MSKRGKRATGAHLRSTVFDVKDKPQQLMLRLCKLEMVNID